jgi:4-hydroxybenzoate polyprenyltransferase
MAHIFQEVRALRFLVISRLWVSLAAAFLSIDVWLANNDGFPIISVIHVFFMTWAGYLFVDATDFRLRKPLMYVSLTGAVFGVMADPLFNLLPLLIATALLLVYTTEWIRQSGVKFSFEFRKLAGLKNVVIACCWTLISSASYLQLPAQQPASLWSWLAANFLFVLVLSVAEDMQDMHHDQTPTVASLLGNTYTIAMCAVILAISVWIAMLTDADMSNQLSHSVLAGATLVLLIFLRKPRKREHAGLLIDGLLVLKGLIPLLIYC